MSGNSIREQIRLAVMAAVRTPVESLGATLHRSPTVAISREQCPALVVFPESESITERANDRVTRELTVRLVALARAVLPAIPETEADRLLTAAHAALPCLGHPRAGMRVGRRGRRCGGRINPGALCDHLPDARHRSFSQRMTPMTSIVLTQPHTHAGQAHKAGERLDVDGSTADRLIANGIARHDRQPVPEPQPQGDGTPIEPIRPITTQRKESKS
ncbi:hypothetical protein [Pokkaliibacter plantistimulans]|nr:hypothetical protein [Pokkaliibacter plantistimulans]